MMMFSTLVNMIWISSPWQFVTPLRSHTYCIERYVPFGSDLRAHYHREGSLYHFRYRKSGVARCSLHKAVATERSAHAVQAYSQITRQVLRSSSDNALDVLEGILRLRVIDAHLHPPISTWCIVPLTH